MGGCKSHPPPWRPILSSAWFGPAAALSRAPQVGGVAPTRASFFWSFQYLQRLLRPRFEIGEVAHHFFSSSSSALGKLAEAPLGSRGRRPLIRCFRRASTRDE